MCFWCGGLDYGGVASQESLFVVQYVLILSLVCILNMRLLIYSRINVIYFVDTNFLRISLN